MSTFVTQPKYKLNINNLQNIKIYSNICHHY
jgi:hypothetical protein